MVNPILQVPHYNPDTCYTKPNDETTRYAPFEGSAISNIPFTVSMLFFPFLLYQMVEGVRTANRIGDPDNIMEASAATFTAVLNLVSTTFLSTPLRWEAPYISMEGVHTLFIGGVFLGIALCAIEGGIEAKALYNVDKKSKQFLLAPIKKLKQHRNSPPEKKLEVLREIHSLVRKRFKMLSKAFPQEEWKTFEEQFTFCIQDLELHPSQIESTYREVYKTLLGVSMSYLKDRFFQINPKEFSELTAILKKKFPKLNEQEFQVKQAERAIKNLRAKKCRLARAITPWTVKTIDEHLLPTLQHLESSDSQLQEKGVKQAETIIETIQNQIDKKYLIHCLGIGCVSLIAAGLVGLLCSVSPLLTIALLSAGTCLLTARYIYAAGTLHHPGWEVDKNRLIPDWLHWLFRTKLAPEQPLIDPADALPLLRSSPHFYQISNRA